MGTTYSAYEAKARFSELLRKVQKGQRIRITYHGQEIAELCPLEPARSTAQRLRELESRGVLTPATGGRLVPLARRKGALQRFLESRD